MEKVLTSKLSLTAVADAIRKQTKSTEQIPFPNGFVSEIESIDAESAYDNGYQQGYTEGEAKGDEQGYNRGLTEGFDNGREFLLYAKNLMNTFLYAEFPEGYELTLKFSNVTDMSTCFRGCKGIRKVTLIGNENKNVLNVGHLFRQSTVEEVDITNFEFIVGNGTNTFSDIVTLKKVIGIVDCSQATRLDGIVNYTNNLEEIRFKEKSIFLAISFQHCNVLSNDSIQSIIDGLADLTNGTAQTLALHANVKAKLTEAQIAQITSKNWTLA